MKITWHANACVEVEALDGTNILCDPWVEPGAFLGSWYQWPPLPTSFEDYLMDRRIDAVYVSHLHPDHFDRSFLARLIRARPGLKIIIAKYAHQWLARACSALAGGRAEVVEIDSGKTITVGDIELTIFVADECNPLACGVSIACSPEPWSRGIDSVGVFAADGYRVVNANDALAVNLVPRLAPLIGGSDLLMGHYGGASPFPQCFPDIVDKASAADAVTDRVCRMLALAADSVSARYVMPFAGQYVLGGRLANLNKDRATLPLDQACLRVARYSKAEVISVVPGGSIDLCADSKDPDYSEPSALVYDEYIGTIQGVSFPYERLEPALLEDSELLAAANLIVERAPGYGLGREVSFVIGTNERALTLDLGPSAALARLGSSPRFANVTSITMPESLLSYLCRRTARYKGFTAAHWNQADTGSHFVWHRNGDFDLKAHLLLNFFGS